MKRGNFNKGNKVTGTQATKAIGFATHTNSGPRTIKRVAQKAIIMVATEMKRVARPIINLLGSDSRKSSSA